MFDEHARQLIDLLPELPRLERAQCRRALSAAYFRIVNARLAVPQSVDGTFDMDGARRLLRRMADALENIAVFDRLNGVPAEPDVESACAFVAGESLSLL